MPLTLKPRQLPFITLALAASLSFAHQPTPTPTPTTTPTRPPPAQLDEPTYPVVSRAELAQWYMRADATYASFVGTPVATADFTTRANQRFDTITRSFFTLNFTKAVIDLAAFDSWMRETGGQPPLPSIGSPIVVRVDPPVWTVGTSPAPTIRILSFGPITLPQSVEAELVLEAAGITTLHKITLTPGRPLILEGPADTLLGQSPALRPGRIDITARLPAFRELARAALFATPEPIEKTRAALEARLAPLDQKSDAALTPAPALTIARARIALLTATPSDSESSEFLADFSTLPAELALEVDALTRNENPYTNKLGLYFRPIPAPQRNIPCWVFVPHNLEAALSQKQPLPLLIALHGAGGDESMFMFGYGDGIIRKLAADRRIIIASPRSEMLGTPANFDALVADLSRDYPIDPQRIYVVGHSMGAAIASGLATSRGSAIAAVACLAGGRITAPPKDAPIPDPKPRTAPVLIIAGPLDPIIPAARLRPGAEAANAAGLPVIYRERENYGHTLIVGTTLPEALDWLLTHSLD
jgi:predicted esterase